MTQNLAKIAQLTRKKKVKEAAEKLLSLKSLDVIDEREFYKALNQLPLNQLDEIPYNSHNMFGTTYEIYKKRFEIPLPFKNFRWVKGGNVKNLTESIEIYKELKAAWEGHVFPQIIAIIDKNIAMLKYWYDIADEIDMISRKVKSTKEIKEQEIKEKIKGKTHPKIKKIVDEIASDFKKRIKANLIKSFKYYQNIWLKKVEELNETDPYKIWPKREDMQFRSYIDQVLEVSNKKELKFTLKSPEQLEMMGERLAKEEIEGFIYKMYDKLGGLLPKSIVDFEFKKLEEHGLYTNSYKVQIKNEETSFIIQNQIVEAKSKYNVEFYRYPTTFHNLIVKGKQVASPDEVTVKKVLNEVYSK